MPTLYVNQPNSVLRVSSDTLRVTSGHAAGADDRELLRVECHRVEAVVVCGRVHVTADALRHCLARGIAVAFLSSTGKFLGRCAPPEGKAADLPLLQFRRLADARRRLGYAKLTIAAKILNAREVLKGLRSNHPHPGLAAAMRELGAALGKVRSAPDAAALMGVEGNAARAYFAALPGAFRGKIQFAARRQHPAPDPANALLSFAYVLLGNRIASLLAARGLWAEIGNFHEPLPGRASLALDMLEEFRAPVVDRFVLRLCNLNVMRPEMFRPDGEGGVRLEPAHQKAFFREWEKCLNEPLRGGAGTVCQTLECQVDRYAMSLRGKRAYRPFVLGGEAPEPPHDAQGPSQHGHRRPQSRDHRGGPGQGHEERP